jgi:uncharacterized membrane protein
MEQLDTDGVARSLAGGFVFHSRPRCSLTRAQERLVFWSLVGVCFGTAIGFAVLGYWLVLRSRTGDRTTGVALETLRKRESDYETLTIDGDAVVLEWRAGKQSGRRELNRQWVQVACDCSAPGKNCRLCVRSHGCETVVGHHLSDEARLKLAATLRSKLQA